VNAVFGEIQFKDQTWMLTTRNWRRPQVLAF